MPFFFFKQTHSMKKYSRDAINSAKDYIDNNPLGHKSINELAVDAGISRNILQKGFKQLFGIKINEYRSRLRMEKAKAMLDESGMTLKQIAAACGYKYAANFTTAFKRLYRQTPSEWQNQNKQGNQNNIA